ncbi:anti-CBASS protein Acb1 family protein [Sphingobium yanoikuyae]|uniref:phage portal protein n=1 Tax=Sphingobium yanoikuyae TaxID=13690 RepID=UPI0026EE43AA|nr:anti-CBASS Acb1 family protein [Sphingobium yanoikuyae]
MAQLLDHRGNPIQSAARSNVVPMVRDGLGGLVNGATGAGTGIDRSVWDAWHFMPMSPQEIVAGYRSNWLLGKIVDIPAEDMVREWRDWQADEAQIETLEETERNFDIIGKVQQAIAYGRLGGGAMLLGYGDANPEAPAPQPSKDSLKYVHVFNRWELTIGEEQRDITSPWFGQPQYFEINGKLDNPKIHPSRVIVFKGSPVPRFPGVTWEDHFWGDSIVFRIDRAVKNAIKANDGFARMIDEAKIDIYRLSGFMQNLISNEDEVRKRVQYTDAGKSSLRGVYLDKDDEFTQRQLTLTGMPEMIEALLSVVAGAADIPATRLLGRAPQGMNSTGDHDEQNYHTMIRSKQRLYLSPSVDRLDATLIPSALGSRPKEISYKWSPLSLPSEKEQAETNKLKAETIKIYVDAALLPSSAIEKATQSMLSDDQWLPGLDKALAEAEAAGEEPGVDESELGIVPLGEKGGGQGSAGSGGNADPNPARRAVNDAWMLEDWAPKTLYVSRAVENRDDIVKWARSQGFTDIAEDLHVTITYSRTPVDWMKMGESWRGKLEIEPGGPRLVEALGPDGKYKALLFTAYELVSRNAEMREKGASFDWPEYQPHISIQVGGDIDLATVKPYTGKIVLGPEIFEEIRSGGE